MKTSTSCLQKVKQAVGLEKQHGKEGSQGMEPAGVMENKYEALQQPPSLGSPACLHFAAFSIRSQASLERQPFY